MVVHHAEVRGEFSRLRAFPRPPNAGRHQRFGWPPAFFALWCQDMSHAVRLRYGEASFDDDNHSFTASPVDQGLSTRKLAKVSTEV